ncbi:DUF4241 domain-containing protein [Brevundimonas sp. GCM10030266]|uniref:DUF4241 domain-containing protein n=1 Tax=Brevundimonas sp. GCM10030266 TaxID=3273386 RepID=UPI00360DEF8E
MLRHLAAIVAAVLGAGCAPAEPGGVTPRPEVLTGAFTEGFVGQAEGERYPVRTLRIGEVAIPSGQVIVADPFLMSTRDAPLTVAVPPGRYPVDVAVADTGAGGQRVALARLVISSEPVTRWSMGVTAGQDVSTLKGDETFGYGVDAGTGAFVDAGLPAWLERRYPPDQVDFYEVVSQGWQDRGEALGPELGIPYGFILIEEYEGRGAAMFSSGWGDGFYTTWIGYDAAGRPAALVTDFAVIEAVALPPPAK